MGHCPPSAAWTNELAAFDGNTGVDPGAATGAPPEGSVTEASIPKGDMDMGPTGAATEPLTGGKIVKLFTGKAVGALLTKGKDDICPTGAPSELLADDNADMLATGAVAGTPPVPTILAD